MSVSTSSWRARTAMLAATVLALAAVSASFGSGGADAKGGTAKPPAGNPAPLTPPIWPAVPGPTFSTNTARLHGFDLTGFIQSATVSTAGCAAPVTSPGGTLVVNGITVVVPCNSVIQMPANTLNWDEAIDIATANAQALALDGSGSNNGVTGVSANTPYPSFEATITGNIVGNRYIAGLIYLSQQSLNGGNGVVSRIDYATGDIWVTPETGSPDMVRLQINDPNGRFGRPQSPDPRFSVDDENPTIHSGTGYPMCVPRVAPAAAPAGQNPATETDPLCPQRNRPWSSANTSCRNWTTAGVTPPAGAGELPVTPAGERCRNYVMKAPSNSLVAADADARQQAPIEPGDAITWSGTLFKGGAGQSDYVSVHTLEDNVGLYTQPGTLPTYLAIGEFGVGSADPSLTSVNGAAQEAQDRIFLEAETTDPKSPVDIYMIDMDPATGREFQRWITPFEMTGESNGPLVPAGLNNTFNIGGGITTMNAGAQVQRARLRATKAPVGVLGSPTRMLRVVSRTQCLPNEYILNSAQASFVQQPGWVTQGGNVVLPNSAPVPAIDSNATAASATGNIRTAGAPCLQSTKVANDLFAGQYAAPVFEYIFPENVSVGDPVVPYDFWHLGFLVNGEGPGNAGRLTPSPW